MAAFTTIATAAGLAISAGTATASFVQAGKQKKKIEAAERDAQKAMQEAKGRLDQNFYEGLGIQKEKFEEERENILSGLSTIVQAGQEGEERGAAVSAGRAALFNQQAQAQSRMAQGQELQRLQELAAREDARNRDALVNINLAEVSGQQRRAADARAARTAALQQGVEGLVSAGQQAMKIPSLYGDDTVSAKNLTVGDPFAEFQNVFGDVEQTSLDRALRSDAIFNPNFDPTKVPVEEFDLDPIVIQ
mgnify:FL=1|tara:strand:+ start:3646 stop:4389 length:744 start_codon:yes stop_codon:yes gene_type:complete